MRKQTNAAHQPSAAPAAQLPIPLFTALPYVEPEPDQKLSWNTPPTIGRTQPRGMFDREDLGSTN